MTQQEKPTELPMKIKKFDIKVRRRWGRKPETQVIESKKKKPKRLRKCDECGAPLDPEEYNFCDDCRDRMSYETNE